MILHEEELRLARAWCSETSAESLSPGQMKLIMDRGRELHRWYQQHRAFHYALNLAVLALLLGGDFYILMRLPGYFIGRVADPHWAHWLLAAAVCGSLHSWLLYSLASFSMHEGAAHHMVFPGRNPVSRAMNFVAANLCRIAANEPGYYSEHHMSHHAKFGTEGDGEFLNFVLPRRFWLTLLPFASLLNYTDFVAHRPPHYTRGRIISAVAALTYHLTYGYLMAAQFGMLFPVLAFILFLPHTGFFLDRLRQFSEHNLMPLSNKDGSRSFGYGFWGLLIGGGPWGSPCHWEHHLVGSIPWYQQLALHSFVREILTPAQRKQFLLQPVIGYPRLMWRLLTEPARFVTGRSGTPTESTRSQPQPAEGASTA